MALNQLPVFLPPLALFRFHFLTTLELHPVEEIASQSKFTFASIYNNFAQRRDVSHCHETICPAEKIFFETRKGIINDGKKKEKNQKDGNKIRHEKLNIAYCNINSNTAIYVNSKCSISKRI